MKQEKKVSKLTFEDTQKRTIEFAKSRGWLPQAPVDLAKSIIIEGAELLEHFQWDTTNAQILKQDIKDKNWDEIKLELADILIYTIAFAHNTGIDLVEAISEKLDKQEKKYPLSEFKDGHNEEFYKKQKMKYREGRTS